MTEIAVAGLGTSQLAGDIVRDVPRVVVTSPSGVTLDSTVTVTWTYTSDTGKPQDSFRVQILDQFSGVLYDSGVIPGTDLTFDCPFFLSGGSLYQAKVIASDKIDSGSGVSAFTSDLVDISSFPTSDEVGSTAEVGINGQGYRLADTPERPYRRSTGQLQAPRLATGDTPFSEAIERYTFVGMGDWTRGAGQRNANREGTDARAYWDSENVNPFELGSIQILPATEELFATAASIPAGAVVASGHLFCVTGTDEVTRLTTPAGAPTTMTFTADTLGGLASDGTRWYAFNTDREIFRGTNTTVGSVWSNLSAVASQITEMVWCSDRLCVVYVNGAGQYVVSTLAPDGSEEVSAGRFKHTDQTVVAVTAGDGYLWYAANRTDKSVIYAWQLGSDSASFIALDLPTGEAVTDLFFYLGNVMIRTNNGTIYRAIQSNGELTPERVVENVGTGPLAGLDKFVLFAWSGMSTDGRSGIGAIDLSTGGWCRWLQAATDTDDGDVNALFVWLGEAGFVVDGSGPQYTTDAPSASGFITSSVYDLASSLTKVFDQISLSMPPLPALSAVEVSVSTDGGASFSSVGSLSQAGVREGRWDIGRQGASITIRLDLTATGVGFPSVTMSQVKLHPLSVVDQVVELPISCEERPTGLNGVAVQDGRGGVELARALEALVGTRVLFQDVDWPITDLAEVWEMVSAEFSSVGVFERRRGHRREAQPVCVCTLRRAR